MGTTTFASHSGASGREVERFVLGLALLDTRTGVTGVSKRGLFANYVTPANEVSGRDGIRTTVGRARFAARDLPDSNPTRFVLGLALLDTRTGVMGFEPTVRRLGTSCPIH